MTKAALRKLRRSIEFTGGYEPLVVRPHATAPGVYQVIHGHNRLRALKAMGHPTVKCIPWDLTDEQARVYLAVMNRVSGRDIPERRAMLLEQLLHQMTIDELVALVPERASVLEELKALAKLEVGDIEPSPSDDIEGISSPVHIHCTLGETEAKSVDLALDVLIEASGGQWSRGRALAELARQFIRYCAVSQRLPHHYDGQVSRHDALLGEALQRAVVPAITAANITPVDRARKRTVKRQPLQAGGG
jgi:ParB-like chromosome segregation protein Spo0J